MGYIPIGPPGDADRYESPDWVTHIKVILMFAPFLILLIL